MKIIKQLGGFSGAFLSQIPAPFLETFVTFTLNKLLEFVLIDAVSAPATHGVQKKV